MKLRTTLIFFMVVLALGFTACTTPSSPSAQPVSISCDEFSTQHNMTRQMSVAAGNTFTVKLCSNATTGFSWSQSAQISDPTVVEQVNHEMVGPENTGSGIVGAPGTEVWTFKALKKGTSTLNMEYSQPWEGGTKGAWTFSLTVTVN